MKRMGLGAGIGTVGTAAVMQELSRGCFSDAKAEGAPEMLMLTAEDAPEMLRQGDALEG